MLLALLQRLKRWGVYLLVLRPYAAFYIKVVCMAFTPRGSLFWRRYIRKPANSFVKTCQQSTWITGTMSYGQMRWKSICLVPMASSMCGGDQERSTKISVSCLQSSMVVRMSWSGAERMLKVLERYISLRETWTPTCTVKYCSRAWSINFNERNNETWRLYQNSGWKCTTINAKSSSRSAVYFPAR